MSNMRKTVICFILIAVTIAALIASLTYSAMRVQYDVSVGEVCPEDIYSTRSIVDTVTTQARKAAAEAAAADIYSIDSSATEAAAASVREFITSLYNVLKSEEQLDKFQLLKASVKIRVDDDILQKALFLSDSQYQDLNKVPAYIESIMSHGVSDAEAAMAEFNDTINTAGFNGNLAAVAAALAENVIRVNKTVDVAATQKAKSDAAAAVADVTYMKNQTIVRRGEVISEAHYAMLKELGFIKGTSSIDVFHTISFISLLILTVFISVLYYLVIGRRKISASPIAVTVICSVLALLGAALSYLSVGGSSKLIYLMPFTICPALITLLLDPHLAMIVNLTVALTAAVHTGDYVTGFVITALGMVTAIIFSKVRRRSHLLAATCYCALFCGVIYAAAYFDTAKNIIGIVEVSLLGMIGAFFGGILTIGTIPFWEAIFDVITPMKLGELSNPEHKLLKKLLLKAPGSYHHSLTVANMAEAAANAIGANALLARVGAYYHDIGKTENPLYFKENQIGLLNPHDTMDPEESAKIIIRHVKDGAALADSCHLPSAVRDIILQHHGTTTASYFLHKARSMNGGDVDASLYTYPGPTPRTKEATIIMLADACEAAIRAMREKGDIDAREAVEKIVSDRIADGQLNSSSLTFADLEKVKDSFAKTLDQYFHKRIIYPQNEVQKEQNNG